MDLGLKDRVAARRRFQSGDRPRYCRSLRRRRLPRRHVRPQPADLQAAAEKIRKQYNAEVFAQAFDVTDAAAVSRFVAAVADKFGSVDICVTNAGGPPAKGFLAATLEEWQRALELNFLSTVYFAREVIPHMQRKRWGRIITLTSITTKQPVPILCFRMRCVRP